MCIYCISTQTCISSLQAKIFSQILAQQTGKATDTATGLYIGQPLSFNF